MPDPGTFLARLLVRYWISRSFGGSRSSEGARRSLESSARLIRPPRGTIIRGATIDGLAAEWVAPDQRALAARPTVLYLHGGGFVAGSPATHRAMVAKICAHAGVRALVPDYRLAPEHPYPAADDDCLSAWRWLLAQGVKPAEIVVGGDSAGGFLTLSLLQRLQREGMEQPAGAFLLSAGADMVHFDGESYTSRAKRDPWFTRDDITWFADQFYPDRKTRPPELSPVNQSMEGLPPLLIQVGDDEILLSDSTRVAERARAAGTEVTLEVAPGMWHVYQAFYLLVPEARRALKRVGEFVRRRLAAAR